MRPAKHILLLAKNEQTASQLRFVLGLRPYFVYASTSYDEVLRQLMRRSDWDALLVEYPCNADTVRPREAVLLPLVIFGENLPLELQQVENGIIVATGRKRGMASLMQAVKRATTLKPGPKKLVLPEIP